MLRKYFTAASIIHNIEQPEELKELLVHGNPWSPRKHRVRFGGIFALYSPVSKGKIYLVGREGSEERLRQPSERLNSNASNAIASWGTNSSALWSHGLIVASISRQTALDQRHFEPQDRCMIADISQPSACSSELKEHCPDLRFIESAMIKSL